MTTRRPRVRRSGSIGLEAKGSVEKITCSEAPAARQRVVAGQEIANMPF